jgi:hypothetical protein
MRSVKKMDIVVTWTCFCPKVTTTWKQSWNFEHMMLIPGIEGGHVKRVSVRVTVS